MTVPSVTSLPIEGATVLLRVDLNVPLTASGDILDPTKIEASLPTIRSISERGGKPILLAHLGKPKGTREGRYGLKPCAEVLSRLLGKRVAFAPDCLGEETAKLRSALEPGGILLLENLRFYDAEEHPDVDPSFGKTLASYGTFYVNDAFGSAHRKHTSIWTLPSYFPGKKAAGLLMEQEIEALSLILYSPPEPFHLIVGGAKISSKIGPLLALLPKVGALYIGGAMAFTFFAALGYPVGNCPYEADKIETALQILETCKTNNIRVFLPVDTVLLVKGRSKIVPSATGIEPGSEGMDIGPETVSLWSKELQNAGSVFWNGPLGVFERPPFDRGTFGIAKALSTLSCIRMIGGGESVAAVRQLGLSSSFTHISTGGGASLEFLEQGTLPGIEALRSP